MTRFYVPPKMADMIGIPPSHFLLNLAITSASVLSPIYRVIIDNNLVQSVIVPTQQLFVKRLAQIFSNDTKYFPRPFLS
jgi:hypothetical protein